MKNKKPSLVNQLKDWAGDKKHLLTVSLLLSAVAGVLFVIPYVLYYFIAKTAIEGYVAGSYDMALITRYSLLAVLFLLLNFVTYFAALMLSHNCAFHIRNNMVKRSMAHLQELSVGYHIHNPSGKLRKVVEQNSSSTESYIAHNLPDFMQSVVVPLVIVIFLFYFDWRLGVACLLPVGVAMIAQTILMGNPEKRAEMMDLYQRSQADISHAAVEYVRGVSVVKVFNQTVHSFRNFNKAITDFRDYIIKWSLDFEPGYRIFMTAIQALFFFFVPLFIILYNNDSSNLELAMSFLFYVIIMPVLTSSMLKVMYMGSFKNMTEDSLMRILEITNEPLPQEPAKPQKPNSFDIVFEDVTFQYKDAHKTALKNFNCKMDSDSITALVGKSGSGKTTIANLIMDFYQPTTGRITVGGVDIKEIGSANMMDLVSYVFQENKLLKMSILDNVRVARPSATKEQVIEAMQKAQCADIIDRLPDGLDTYFGQKGVYLSGGEIQRVAIARALLKDAPIVILDEATAFTDPENEHKIKMAFDELLKDKTVVMIAHRLSSIKDADNIIVVSEGELAEQGQHQALVDKDDHYAAMWREFNKSITWTFGQAIDNNALNGGGTC